MEHFVFTICADFYGRKPALIVSLIILATGSILVAVSTNIFQVSIFRLITGIGIGAEVVIAAAYIGEMSSKSKRGRYTSLIFLIGTIGFAASGPVSFVLLQQQGKMMGIEGWRVLMGIPGVIAYFYSHLGMACLNHRAGFYQREGLRKQACYS